MAKMKISLDESEIRAAVAVYVGKQLDRADVDPAKVQLGVTKEWRGHGTQEYQADVIQCEVIL